MATYSLDSFCIRTRRRWGDHDDDDNDDDDDADDDNDRDADGDVFPSYNFLRHASRAILLDTTTCEHRACYDRNREISLQRPTCEYRATHM